MAASNQTITVAAGQISARLMNEAADTLASIESAIIQASAHRADLLVLPECAYPAYLLGSVTSYRAGEHMPSTAFVAWLGEQAARHRLHLICGFVEDTGQTLHNSAIFIDDKGNEIGRTRKRFLWHADHEWFTPGQEIQAFDSDIGRIGMAICAETRVPEILATLVADGAEMIAVPTCWINAAKTPGEYENLQVEFLIRARALEFSVPFVCADKSGVELAAVGYVGRSRIVRADGSLAAEALATGEEVISAQLVLRRPPELEVCDAHRERLFNQCPPRRPSRTGPYPIKVAAVPAMVTNRRFAGEVETSLLKPLHEIGVKLLLTSMPQEDQAQAITKLAANFGIHAISFPHSIEAFMLGPVRTGCVVGKRINSFAEARALALDGVELLMCFDMPEDEAILRTRAVENRIFVMGVSEHSAIIIDPDGNVLARTDNSQPAEVIAEIDLSTAADKLIAPKTDIFSQRRVQTYRF